MSIALFSKEEWFPHVVALASACIEARPVTAQNLDGFLHGIHWWTDLNTRAFFEKYGEIRSPVRFTGQEVLNARLQDPRLTSVDQARATLLWLRTLRYNCTEGDVVPDQDDLAVMVSWYGDLVRRALPEDL